MMLELAQQWAMLTNDRQGAAAFHLQGCKLLKKNFPPREYNDKEIPAWWPTGTL